jgi:hypothetical protein
LVEVKARGFVGHGEKQKRSARLVCGGVTMNRRCVATSETTSPLVLVARVRILEFHMKGPQIAHATPP